MAGVQNAGSSVIAECVKRSSKWYLCNGRSSLWTEPFPSLLKISFTSS
jgi:hypothetical protein